MVVSITGGAGTSYRLRFDARDLVVGRASDADVMLSHGDVAPRHLRLRVAGEVIEVVDLGSPTGTTINGKRITRPRKITYRDRIRLGPYELKVSLLLRVKE
jgi:pilus assembly protein CpaF